MIKSKCSFCGKDQDRVRLAAGPKRVATCEEYVQFCPDVSWLDIEFPWSGQGVMGQEPWGVLFEDAPRTAGVNANASGGRFARR